MTSSLSTTALLLVLAAAVAHATWNILAHGVSRIGMPFVWWGAVASTVLWAPVVPLTGGLGGSLRSIALGVGVSGVLHFVYMVVLQRGYTYGNLSTVYATARGSGPLLSVVVAVLLLGERPGAAAYVGVAAVVTGVLAIGLLDRRDGEATRRRRWHLDPGIAFGLLTGAAIAAYTIWDAHAVRTWDLQPVAYMVGSTLVQVPLCSLAMRDRHRELVPILRAHWPRVLAFGAFSPLAYILVLAAIRLAPVALVAPLREVSVVLVSVFGVVVLREGRATARLSAAVLVVVGIALLAV